MANLEKLMKTSHGNTVVDGDPLYNDPIDPTDTTSIVAAAQEPFWDLAAEDLNGDQAGIDGADYIDNPWDRVQLGIYQLPGIWHAYATPSLQMDVQKPRGYDGAAIITRGALPSPVTITGQIWTPRQWQLFQQMLPGIWRKPNKIAAQDVVLGKAGRVAAVEKDQGQIVTDQQSLSIVHPSVNLLQIFYVVVQGIASPVPDDIPGVMRILIQCMEYIPEPARLPSAIRKVKGVQSTTRGPNAIDKAIAEKDARKPKPPSSDKKALEP